MTVIDLPMSLVYGPIAFGCLLMLLRFAAPLAMPGWLADSLRLLGSTSNID